MKLSRRTFIEGVSSGLLAGALSMTGACARFRYVGSRIENGRLAVSLAEFGSGPFALVEAPHLPLPIYLYRHADGQFTAVLTRCMHQGCEVEPADGHLVCPCHGSEYDNRGLVLQGPTQLPLIRFPVETVGDAVYIDLAESRGAKP